MKLAQTIPLLQNIKKYMEIKRNINLIPTPLWSIANKVLPYSILSKNSLLSIHENLEVINYPPPEELLHETSGLISKCRGNTFL